MPDPVFPTTACPYCVGTKPAEVEWRPCERHKGFALRWFRIEAPHFTAGIRFGGDDRADHGAPILKWMNGKALPWVQDYCRRKGWKMEAVQP